MTDKQDAPSTAFSLPGWQVLEAAGADAQALLQAQTMNDVRSLQPGNWQWNGWLTPKGRVIALFMLAMIDDGRFWLVSPDFAAADLAARLRRFVFRSKVRFDIPDQCESFGTFVSPEVAKGSQLHADVRIDAGHVEFDLGATGGARTLMIDLGNAPRYRADRIERHPGAERWKAFDLAHGLPRLAMDQSEQWTPQMLSLERLGAFSLKKGCYPGQEIVARTHYLGQAKRGLARVVGAGVAPGRPILAGDRELGSIVCTAGDEALAVLAADRPTSDWTCTGSPCSERPLLDGLAR